MPLSPPAPRKEAHHRVIDMRAYAREDGLYDVEGRLVDTKPFEFERLAVEKPIPIGEALHDISVRLTFDRDYLVHAIEASSDVTPFGLCKEAEATLQVLVGERIARGWSAKVKEKLRGSASCTHLMEMLIPMATTALQGVRGLQPKQERRAAGDGVPMQLDTCYAYGRSREVVLRFWPQQYVPTSK
ncbi:DUF2889 domain-containing protein [Ottowia caeni]|uniref:DUF2889 domain-containing protein n=1 Tax=Ottowia caeni TaxID=2870339 RepID=UPI001E36BF8B|nr:DUF2889 domain-containing protein [Ottowia caeni]